MAGATGGPHGSMLLQMGMMGPGGKGLGMMMLNMRIMHPPMPRPDMQRGMQPGM
jgi:hypothetical protein